MWLTNCSVEASHQNEEYIDRGPGDGASQSYVGRIQCLLCRSGQWRRVIENKVFFYSFYIVSTV